DPDFSRIDAREPYDVRVVVDGNDYSVFVAGANGDNAIWTGSDPALTAGKVGIHSWAQRARTANHPFWGTEAQTLTVTDAGGTLLSEDFGIRAVRWRPLA